MFQLIRTADLNALRADLAKITTERNNFRAAHASASKSRDRAWTFILAVKREGLLPDGAWKRRANSFTASESEGDIEDDQRAADAVRADLNRWGGA